MSNYDIIKSFLVFAESRNILEASQKLKLTQPAVSQHLKSFEMSYDKPVFTFKGKQKVLTNFGEEIYQSLSPHYNAIDNTTLALQNKYKDLSQLKIRIGARLGAIRNFYSHVTFPGAIHYHDMGSPEVLAALAMNKVEFGLSRFEPDSLEIISKKIVDLDIFFVAHRSLFKTKKPLEEFYRKELWLSEKLYTYSYDLPYIEEWCSHYEIKLESLNVQGVLSDWKCVLDNVERRKGYTFCPGNYAKENRNLIAIPVQRNIISSFKLFLLYSKVTKKLFDPDLCFNLEKIKKSLEEKRR